MLNKNEKLAIKRVIEIYPEHSIVFEDNSEDNDCSFSEFFKSDYILIEVSDNCSQIRMLRKDRRPCPACVCHYIDQLRATEKLKMEHPFSLLKVTWLDSGLTLFWIMISSSSFWQLKANEQTTTNNIVLIIYFIIDFIKILPRTLILSHLLLFGVLLCIHLMITVWCLYT